MRILVTGAAGFIGSAVMESLVRNGHRVTGMDSLSAYYDPRLKTARLERTGIFPGNGGVTECCEPATGPRRDRIVWKAFPWGEGAVSSLFPLLDFVRLDITDRPGLQSLFESGGFDTVVHMAAQAGVGHSMADPHSYGDTNLCGFLNVLEECRRHSCRLVYASSSSVYGEGAEVPFREDSPLGTPLSLYGATKRSNELMAASYCRLYGMKATGLRFFTVYGPWGRPDMAPLLFADAIMNGKSLRLNDSGRALRDFTYIGDVVRGVVAVTENPGCALHPVYNLGFGFPVPVVRFASLLEKSLGTAVGRECRAARPGDLSLTWADPSLLESDFGFRPSVTVEEGVRLLASWVKAEAQKSAPTKEADAPLSE